MRPLAFLLSALCPMAGCLQNLAPIKFVTSTFVNQNNYVTFAGIGLIAAVAAILRLYRRALAELEICCG